MHQSRRLSGICEYGGIMSKKVIKPLLIIVILFAISFTALAFIQGEIYFAGTQYTYSLVDDGVAVTGYRGKSKDVSVPAHFLFLNVVEIDTLDNSSVENVVIPDSVKRIKRKAFLDYVNLKTVTLSNSLDDIESRTFMGCSGIEKIEIPDSVKSIETLAFADCTGLKDVTGGKNVTYVEAAEAFRNTPWVASKDYVEIGDNVLVRYNGKENVVKVPQSIKCVCPDAFYYFQGNKVIFPASLTKLDCFYRELKTNIELQFESATSAYLLRQSELEFKKLTTVIAPKGSKMEQICRNQGIQFKASDSE